MATTQHRSFTASFKLSVISRAEQIGNRAAAREFEVDERCVRRWRTEKEELENMPQLKRAKRRGAVRWPNLEDDLEKWVKEQQGKGVEISTKDISSQAKIIAQQMNITDFKGGPCWCSRFMKRKEITIDKYIREFQISIKKEDSSSSEETSIITDASGKAVGESTLKIGMFPDAEPVIIKEEFSESLLKDALPEDSLDETQNEKTGDNGLDDKKVYSEKTSQLSFRIKKEIPTVKLKEQPSLLDKTANQGFASDPSSLDLQTGKMSVNTYPKKKNARRLSTEEKGSQRKK